uniref:Uncharacterized protein n=1 Tax=Manihot esculenta TaxID=3983 RepID=A0A251LT02_MANES
MCSQVAPAGLPPPLDELSLMKVYVADGPFKLEYFLSLLNDLRPPAEIASLIANVFNGQTTCLELISACRIRANPEALQQ